MASITSRPRMLVQGTAPRLPAPAGAEGSQGSTRPLPESAATSQAGTGSFDLLAPAFTRPTYHRFALLAVAAILTLGGHTICNLLRYLGALAPGSPPAITASSLAGHSTLGSGVDVHSSPSRRLDLMAVSNWLVTIRREHLLP